MTPGGRTQIERGLSCFWFLLGVHTMTHAGPTWIERGGVLFGARAGPEGPIGGGEGYERLVTRGDLIARTSAELLDALARAREGLVVFLPGDAAFNVTDRVFLDRLVIRVPAGVTLAGDRGYRGSPGALLYSEAFQTIPLIEALGPGVRITGLRLRGPDPDRRLDFHYRVFGTEQGRYEDPNQAYYRFPNSEGISTRGFPIEVDNCEISGWSHAGIALYGGKGHRLHHCFIHHCQRMGLGYGICHDRDAEALIEFNLFQDNKHHIAGSGMKGSGYQARHNVVLPYTESHAHPITGEPYGQDHLFDMHGGRDRSDGTDVAGGRLRISNNTFFPTYVAVCIRGIPEQAAEIHHNWFAHPDPGPSTVISDGRTVVSDNLYGAGGMAEPLRGGLELLQAISLAERRTGLVRIRASNPSHETVRGSLLPQVIPAGCGSIQPGPTLPVNLPPGGEQVWEVAVSASGQCPPRGILTLAMTAAGERRLLAEGGLSYPSVVMPIEGHRMPVLPHEALDWPNLRFFDSTPALPMAWHGSEIGRIAFGQAGDSLLVAAEVFDREVQRDPVVWKTSCVEVFSAGSRGGVVTQIFLAPAGGDLAAAAFLAAAQSATPLPGITLQCKNLDVGYSLRAQIPLDALHLPPGTKEFLLEFQAGAVLEPGHPRRFTTLFGSESPYKTSKGYAHFTAD